jgi:hypothetical protein
MFANEIYCDYVFGRMIKWGCSWNETTITVPDIEYRQDYQSFCRRYRSNDVLAEATLESLRIDYVCKYNNVVSTFEVIRPQSDIDKPKNGRYLKIHKSNIDKPKKGSIAVP